MRLAACIEAYTFIQELDPHMMVRAWSCVDVKSLKQPRDLNPRHHVLFFGHGI